jgi:hypothetical protein
MANIRTAMNRGAFDFVTKPIDFADLETTIAKTIRHVEALREARIARQKPSGPMNGCGAFCPRNVADLIVSSGPKSCLKATAARSPRCSAIWRVIYRIFPNSSDPEGRDGVCCVRTYHTKKAPDRQDSFNSQRRGRSELCLPATA